jgi:hypothetical protein
MKNFIVLVIVAFVLALNAGCSGLAVWQSGHYYHSMAVDSVAVRDVHTVGIYVFSDGESETKGEFNLGLAPGDWPGSEVVPGATFSPDSSNAGPSLELANALVKELNNRGYNAKAATDLGQSNNVTVEQCMKNAKDAGYDGVLIAYYKGFKSWNTSTVSQGVTSMGHAATITNITPYKGFLYLTHGGFFDVKTGEELWKNSYYGMVQHAHMFNLSDEPFVSVVNEAVVDNGAEDYLKAAPIAADVLLDPGKFKETTKPFPSAGEKRHRM